MIDQNKLQQIYDYFGHAVQKRKLEEECEEYLKSGESEEVADIWLIAHQLYLNSPKIRELVEHKINRTVQRINEDYYDRETGRKHARI